MGMMYSPEKCNTPLDMLTVVLSWQNITLNILAFQISHMGFLALICAHCYHKSLKWHTPIIEQVNYHTFEFLPLKSTRFKMSHSISTH